MGNPAAGPYNAANCTDDPVRETDDDAKAVLDIDRVGIDGGGESAVSAAEWGNLSGRFVFDGVPPIPEKLKITSDQPMCGQHDLQNEALLVNPHNKGVQNIIIYLYQNKSGARLTPYDSKEVPIHEDYLACEKEVVKLDNKGCRFDPHVALIWNRQKVLLGNSDPVGHNVKIDCRDNLQSNDTIPSGDTIEKQFDKAERFPAPVSCSIHPWMKGWIVIRDTPYMAVTDADGKFEIKKPSGGRVAVHVLAGAGGLRQQGEDRRESRGVEAGSQDAHDQAGSAGPGGHCSWLPLSSNNEKWYGLNGTAAGSVCHVAADCDGIDGRAMTWWFSVRVRGQHRELRVLRRAVRQLADLQVEEAGNEVRAWLEHVNEFLKDGQWKDAVETSAAGDGESWRSIDRDIALTHSGRRSDSRSSFR